MSKAVFGPRTRVQTPPGIAAYPSINAPDTRFDDPPGVYKCDLRFDPQDEAWADFVKKMEEFGKEVVGEIGGDLQLPIKTDKEGGMFLRTKLKAENGKGVSQRPAVYDAQVNIMEPVPSIGGGSKLSLSLDLSSSLVQGNAYVTAHLKGVQVLDLKSFGAHTPEAYGMKPEEGYCQKVSVPEENEEGDY
jgi:hypothetical protein